MTLEFGDASYDVVEDDFSVVSTSAVQPELLAHLEPNALPYMLSQPVAHLSSGFSGSMANSVHLPIANLDKAELAVFATLHHLTADLGEPVTVSRSNREIQVGVWQLPAERQRELRTALECKPGIRVELTPPRIASKDDAVRSTLAPPPAMATNVPLYIPDNSSGDDQRLLKFFGNAESEQEFTSQTLGTSTTILSHLYALQILLRRFPPEKEEVLGPDERAQLAALVQDHAAAIATNLDRLNAQLAPLDVAFEVSPSEPSADLVAGSWQRNSVEALEEARAADHLLRSVLTISPTPASLDIALPQIKQVLAHLGTEIKNLSVTDR